MDWVAWHADYEDPNSALSRRLEIVQRHISTFLSEFEGSPVRVVSICAGEGRDILGAIETVGRLDIVGRLVELNPDLAARARVRAAALGLDGLEVVVADAGQSAVYLGAIPADLVLEVGVFGNIAETDRERLVRATPGLCAPDAVVMWTRHRAEPDQTPLLRRWYAESGFEEIAFDKVPDSDSSVGVVVYRGAPVRLAEQQLFVFNRTA